ncbi:MAG: sigma-E processing peptidase SpoIIGA [Clostridia bacterium]|nr:sigma-E processing peptidase SpoIIGA [Clostridia bacterium]
MYRSIESVLIAEFIIDAATVWAALRPARRVQMRRLFMASALSAILSGAMLIMSPAPYIRAIIALLASPIIARICAGSIGLNAALGAAACMLIISAVISTAIHISGAESLPMVTFIALTAAAITAHLLRRQRRWLDSWEVGVHIEHNGEQAVFTALIDTGNRLTEPVSGLPVMVMEHQLVKNMLPDGFDPHDALSNLTTSLRLAAYGGVGGNGALGCFMPERLLINNIPVSGVWIGVYPGRLPGKYRALAPPEVIRSININRSGG